MYTNIVPRTLGMHYDKKDMAKYISNSSYLGPYQKEAWGQEG